MNLKKVFFIVFALVILAIPLTIIFSSENVLENGHRHKIHITGFDPFDPFRGKYLRITIDTNMPYEEGITEGQSVYVLLEKDTAGYSFFSACQKNKPDHDDYIIGEVERVRDSTARVKLDNLSKYFINEHKAEKAQEVIWDFRRNNPEGIYLAIRVLDGEALIEDIFVNETPLLDYIETEE